MIIEGKEICRRVSVKEDVPQETVESINSIIFKTLSDKMRDPTHLIMSLAPLGNFYYREKKSRMRLESLKDYPGSEEFGYNIQRILDMYKIYSQNKLNFKYEKFGKESHDAYILAKEQKKLLRSQKIKP